MINIFPVNKVLNALLAQNASSFVFHFGVDCSSAAAECGHVVVNYFVYIGDVTRVLENMGVVDRAAEHAVAFLSWWWGDNLCRKLQCL